GGAPAVWLRSRRAAVPSLGIASKGSRGLLGHAGPRRSRDRRATSRARPHDAAGSGAIELRAVPRPGDRIEEAMASSANDEDRVDERDAGESDRLALTPDRTVVVVGGGIVGLSIARELARRGLRVVVVEADRCGAGASSRAIGV